MSLFQSTERQGREVLHSAAGEVASYRLHSLLEPAVADLVAAGVAAGAIQPVETPVAPVAPEYGEFQADPLATSTELNVSSASQDARNAAAWSQAMTANRPVPVDINTGQALN